MTQPETLDLFTEGVVCGTRGLMRCSEAQLEPCRCSEPAGHFANHRCLWCHQTFTPAPPTGPAAEIPNRAAGSYGAYLEWRDTDVGQRFFNEARAAALEADGRFSPRSFLAWFRDEYKVRVNDHFSPYLADELITACPELEAIIERRKRKKVQI
jgi:hypothetical protein